MRNSSTLARWPQFRKFSSLSSGREWAKHIAIAAAVALACFASLRPEARQQRATVSPSGQRVTLQRVVIVGKRERLESPVTSYHKVAHRD